MVIAAAVALTALLTCGSVDEPAPQQTPGPAARSADVNRMIAEGTALHDRQDYDGAIRTYEGALALDPGNGKALYEKAYSQWAKRDLNGALETANQAALAPKERQRSIVVLIGNIQDDLGDSAAAIATFTQGIKTDPGYGPLHFNLGMTYSRLKRFDEARFALERSASLAPGHSSSHLYLGETYAAQGYRLPALLALTRFLVLENATGRSARARRLIDELFRAGIQRKGGNDVEITVDSNTPKDEGDFRTADLLVPMIQTSLTIIPEAGGKLEGPPEMHRLQSLLSSVGETPAAERGKGFAAEYYAPFAVELVTKRLEAAYAAVALRGSGSPEIESWIAEHAKDVKEVSTLISSYAWPRVQPSSSAPTPTPPAE